LDSGAEAKCSKAKGGNIVQSVVVKEGQGAGNKAIIEGGYAYRCRKSHRTLKAKKNQDERGNRRANK
jgi:hypothetical protein